MKIKERLEQIKSQVDKLDNDRSIIEEKWIEEIQKETSNVKFDAYSKKGKKKILSITDKYTPLICDIEEERNELTDEYNNLAKKLEKIEENK